MSRRKKCVIAPVLHEQGCFADFENIAVYFKSIKIFGGTLIEN